MKMLARAAILACAMIASVPAFAQTFTGTTTGRPGYNRVIANGSSAPTVLSATGTNVKYDVLSFTAATAGSYSFLSTAGYDNYLTLYSGSFNPASPLSNALIANDDFPNIGSSGFSYALATGTSYFAVMSGFANADAGAYTLAISGPAAVSTAVSAAPEPATWAFMILGFGVVGVAMRRRRLKGTVAYA